MPVSLIKPVATLSLAATLFFGAPVSSSTDPELRRLLRQAVSSDNGFVDRFDAEVWLLDMSRRLEKFVQDPKSRIE